MSERSTSELRPAPHHHERCQQQLSLPVHMRVMWEF